MADTLRFPYQVVQRSFGRASLMPIVPITLSLGIRTFETEGLLDTGAAVNVLPYKAGLEIGANWNALDSEVQLTGSLSRHEARILTTYVSVGTFDPVEMVFAWTQVEKAPLLLGQTNFFMMFDAFFSRTEKYFELSLRS